MDLDANSAYPKALFGERVRSARRLALIRVGSLAFVLTLTLYYGAVRRLPDWSAPLPVDAFAWRAAPPTAVKGKSEPSATFIPSLL